MKRNTDYQPPFPWFGGKSSVAAEVWNGLGDVVNYVEPFFGSGAVLFLRPGGPGRIETVNDAVNECDPPAAVIHGGWRLNDVDMPLRLCQNPTVAP